jgi:hypothetical protein
MARPLVKLVKLVKLALQLWAAEARKPARMCRQARTPRQAVLRLQLVAALACRALAAWR